MIRALRRWLDGPDDGLPAQLARLKAETTDLQRPTYRVGMETPERDESKPNSVHLWSDADLLAEQLRKDREQQVQPKNVRVFARGIKS